MDFNVHVIISIFITLPALFIAADVPCPITNDTCTCGHSDIKCTDLISIPEFQKHSKVWSGLYMTDQKIRSLPAGSFHNLTVEKIVLDRNDLSRGLKPASFSEVSGTLRELHMSDCNLRSIPARMLQKMGNLRELHLSDNQLETLPDFTSTPLLKALILWGNSIHKLNRTSFAGLKQLERLDLDHNQLKPFHKTFHELIALRSLQIAHNQITTLPRSPFRKLSKLRRLSINNNGLEFMFDNAFAGLKNLAVLELHNNLIDILADDIFTGLGKLKVLNLDNNKIEFLWARTLSDLVNLQEIHLSNNQMKLLPQGLFSRLQYLRRVFLDGNSLKTVAQCVLPEHPVVVSAFRNPLECDCDLRYVVARKHAASWVRGTCTDHVTSVETLEYYEQCNTKQIKCDI